MRIKNKGYFILGILDVLLSIVCVIISIVQHRTDTRFIIAGFLFVCGIFYILDSIETKAQRQKRKEELQAIAKMYGWCEDSKQSNEREEE